MNRKAFKQLRERLELSQQQFGLALGFYEFGARFRVSEIERGDKPISRHVEILCQYMERYGILGKWQSATQREGSLLRKPVRKRVERPKGR